MSQVLDEVVEEFEPATEFVSVLAGSRMPVLLGLDIGTSGVRAALFDEKGSEITDAGIRINSPTLTIGVNDFIDADVLLEQVAQTLDALFAKLYEPVLRIELISLACFWHSLVGIDDAERPTTPVLGWSDTRAAKARLYAGLAGASLFRNHKARCP